MGNEKQDKYLLVAEFEGRTNDSRAYARQRIIEFETEKGKDVDESKLKEILGSVYNSNPGDLITKMNDPVLYKFSEKIIPKKRHYETPLNKMYENPEDDSE